MTPAKSDCYVTGEYIIEGMGACAQYANGNGLSLYIPSMRFIIIRKHQMIQENMYFFTFLLQSVVLRVKYLTVF